MELADYIFWMANHVMVWNKPVSFIIAGALIVYLTMLWEARHPGG